MSSMRRADPKAQVSKVPKLKVQVWIYRKTQTSFEVLLLLLKPARGGYWQPVTGGVNEGESLQAAALREAQEESGLDFTLPPESLDYRFSFSARGGDFEEHVFALRAEGQKVRLDFHEHVDFRWMPIGEAAAQLRHASNVDSLEQLIKKLSAV